jgi:hypothetical protein
MSVTRTLRLDKELDEAIQKIALQERVSVNTVVSRTLRRFADWDVHAERFGMVMMTPAMLVQLMDRMSPDEARELGRASVRDSAKGAVESIFINFTFATAIEFLRRFGQYAGRFEFEHSEKGKEHVILLRHGTGLKWSLYYEGVIRGIFEDGLGMKVQVRATPDTCVAKLEL